MATFSVRATREEDKLIRAYADVKGIGLDDWFK